MGVTANLMTFEEFERLPDEPGKLELLDGELIRLPPAFTKHMRVSLRIYNMLQNAVRLLHEAGRAMELGEVFMETGFHIGSGWLQPDVSISHAGQPETDYLEGAPALAIEVISDANTAEQMERKVRAYLSNGGREVWLVYPKTKSIWVYHNKSAVEVEGMLSSDLLAGVSLDLSQVFD